MNVLIAEKIVSDVDEKKQPLVRNIVTQLIASGYTLDLNERFRIV